MSSPDSYKLMGMISYWDLRRPKPSLAELAELARQFNRDEAASFFARLNLYLSLAESSRNFEELARVQEILSRQVLSEDRLNEISGIFDDKELFDKWILLSRSQLLVAVKLVLLYGSDSGGNQLQTDDERSKVGEFALAINSCYGPNFDEPDWPRDDTVVYLLANAELHNAETLVNGFVRTKMLIGPVLRDHIVRCKGQNLPPFERIFTLLNRLNFRDFLDISLYLHAEHGQMLDELIESGSMTYLDVSAPKRYVSGRYMKCWAELMAVNLSDLRALMTGSEHDRSFYFDFTIFRRFPLWRSGENHYFCIDAMFLAERLSSSGFYWTVINGLIDDTLRSSFQRTWGELMEEYVRDLFGDCYRGRDGVFIRKPIYDDGEEVFDSAILSDGALVPIEIKSSVISAEQKYAGDPAQFREGFSAKFGKDRGAAVEQLLRNIGQLFSPCQPRGSVMIPSNQVREILPIVVVHEPILRFGLAAQMLAKEFEAGLSDLELRSDLAIYPLQLLTPEDLERLVPYLERTDFSLVDCLRAKASEDPRHASGFSRFVESRFLPDRGIETAPNSKLLGRFEWLSKATLWRVYKGDYFDHSLASRGEPSERAVICARPIGGDELLRDEAIGFRGYDNVNEAYKAIREIRDRDFPKQNISTDWFECAVVDEFGFLIGEPPSTDSSTDPESKHGSPES